MEPAQHDAPFVITVKDRRVKFVCHTMTWPHAMWTANYLTTEHRYRAMVASCGHGWAVYRLV